MSKSFPPPQQWLAACRMVYVLCMVSYYAGFFLSLSKSITYPVTMIRYLGIMVDSENEMFWVPEDRVNNLLLLINTILQRNSCSITELESLVGKCRSMAIAVPAAILYTRTQYSHLSDMSHKTHNPNKRKQHVIPRELREELLVWKQLKQDLINGSKWYGADRGLLRIENLMAHTDASSRRWAGICKILHSIIRLSEDFSMEDIHRHINEKEAIALYEFLFQLLTMQPSIFEGKKILVQVDNEVLCNIYNKGGSSKQSFITDICKKLFWLQIRHNFHLDVSWISTHLNQADGMTREDVQGDLRLSHTRFIQIWKEWGPFRMDLMASSTNVQMMPHGSKLMFYSRYQIPSALATDVFTQHIGLDPISGERAPLNYCFPPHSLLLNFINHLQRCKGRCVVIMPKVWGSPEWNVVKMGLKHSRLLSTACTFSDILTFRGNEYVPFGSKYVMIAALLDFS